MIKIYAKSRCKDSLATRRYLEKHGVDFDYIRVKSNDPALSHIQSLGYDTLPVVDAGDIHWSGYRPELLDTLIGGDTMPEADADREDISIDDEFGDWDENGL